MLIYAEGEPPASPISPLISLRHPPIQHAHARMQNPHPSFLHADPTPSHSGRQGVTPCLPAIASFRIPTRCRKLSCRAPTRCPMCNLQDMVRRARALRGHTLHTSECLNMSVE